MANKRQLKKAIRRACGKIAGECLTAQVALPETNPESWDELVVEAAMLQVAAIKRAHPVFGTKPKECANGKEYKKARRAFFKENEKELTAFMRDEVGKIADQMNKLIGKK